MIALRCLATVVWTVLMAVVILTATVGGGLVKAAQLMYPAVLWLAEFSDGE